MKPTRRRFKTKAEWADFQATELRKAASARRFQSSGGSYSKAARKYEGIQNIEAEAARYERLAAQYRKQGK